ncbi:MAG: hypothetical protein FWE14_01125 [Lachnospiraceae bacterium]|nr:hypothetical protein [Lachnospiraceae bacterium]
MKKNCFKKLVNFMLALVIFVSLISAAAIPAYACTTAHWGGSVYYSRTNLRIGIAGSAINSVLTFNLYSGITGSGGWNNLHSPAKVHISSVINLPASPSASRDVDVVGWGFGGGVLGELIAYDSMGRVTLPTSNWSSAVIRMNDSVTIWGSTASERTINARAVFYHEVGHLFKLAHPVGCISLAVMQTGGFVGNNNKSAYVMTHDANNINARW